jgi:hypothetical protein
MVVFLNIFDSHEEQICLYNKFSPSSSNIIISFVLERVQKRHRMGILRQMWTTFTEWIGGVEKFEVTSL